jgi:hypothetical protein
MLTECGIGVRVPRITSEGMTSTTVLFILKNTVVGTSPIHDVGKDDRLNAVHSCIYATFQIFAVLVDFAIGFANELALAVGLCKVSYRTMD